jgi:hypothetical protein
MRSLLSIGALALLVGCGGPEDTLAAFDVTLVTFSDCSQVGQGGVNCTDEEELRSVTMAGRWIVDYRGIDTFSITTDDGRVLPGVYFNNDGRTQSPNCAGQGGTCHFARTRSDEQDADTGCLRISERVIDVYVLDGEMSGQMSAVEFTDQSCGTPLIEELLVEVEGALVDEPVRAREVVLP